MHDQTAVRTEGIAEQFRHHPTVKAEVDDGYRGLANEFPDQDSAPPKKPNGLDGDNAPLTEYYGWRQHKRRQSSRRICVEHANAEHRQWRPLQRYAGRRETYGETHRARRRPGLRPRRQAHPPAQDQHRTRPRPPGDPLNQPSAEPPGQHIPTSIAGQPVTDAVTGFALPRTCRQ
ncbi:hypothetical protein [Streptomyces sp. WZ-12]|uniref:hypothetical protein n=1 Tax=Streptomyces sp. WZ-12 TaxID=3030210 RepID=UPI002380C897|nr:hypothetical protein [Streptomyces sp. WZ-12]